MKKRTQITFPDISHKKQMIIYTFDIYFVKPILKGLFIILLNHCLISWYGPSVIPTRGTVGNEYSRTPVQ